MKIISLLSVALLACMVTDAQNVKSNKGDIVFTTIHKNAITSVKNQNRSGTCWDYATVDISRVKYYARQEKRMI
jgi:C1A family cysteine protease